MRQVACLTLSKTVTSFEEKHYEVVQVSKCRYKMIILWYGPSFFDMKSGW